MRDESGPRLSDIFTIKLKSGNLTALDLNLRNVTIRCSCKKNLTVQPKLRSRENVILGYHGCCLREMQMVHKDEMESSKWTNHSGTTM